MPVHKRILFVFLALLLPATSVPAAEIEKGIPTLPALPALGAAMAPAAPMAQEPAALVPPAVSPPASGLSPAANPALAAAQPLAAIRPSLDQRPAEAAGALDQAYDNAAAVKSASDASPVAGSESSPAALAPAAPDWTRGVFLPPAIEQPLGGDPLGVTVHRLSNGMTVYLSPNPQEPRVSFNIAVRAGSRHDPAEATGMAHYLEHMQFKGTEKLGTTDYASEKPHLDRIQQLYDRLFVTKDQQERQEILAQIDAESQAAGRYAVPNEYDKLYAGAGFTEINAHTALEETVYTGSFPSNKAHLWATVEADRLSDPVYRIFLPELEAVYEEYNSSLDDPDSGLYSAQMAALFPGHPYGRDVLGLAEHLKNPSLSRMRRFFSDYYHPNNMAIALSGDFDRREMLALLESTFGKLPPAEIPSAPPAAVEPLRGVQRSEIKAEAQEAVSLSWQLPGHSQADENALALAGHLLSNLLIERLSQAQEIKSVSAGLEVQNEAGYWTINAVPKPGQTLEEAERRILDQVARFKAGDFTDADVKTAATELEVGSKRILEDNDRRVDYITDAFIAGRPWEQAAGAIAHIKTLTKADVMRTANLYLGENRAVVYRRQGAPQLEKVQAPKFTPVPIDTARKSAFFDQLTAMSFRPLKPRFLRRGRDYRVLKRPWGRLFWAPDPVTDLFTLELRFDLGTAHDKRLNTALTLLQLSGAGDMTLAQFNKRMDAMGSSMEAKCTAAECTIALKGLEKNLKETLRLALLRMAKPNVTPEAFENMVEVLRAGRADRKLDPEQLFKALGSFAAKGRDGDFFQDLTPSELDALKADDLKGSLTSLLTYRRDALYTGQRGAQEVARTLSAAQPVRRFRSPPAHEPAELNVPPRPRVLFVHREGLAQAIVGAYASDGPFDPAKRIDARLYDMAMGGSMSGIYFQEMRESRALAYSAGGGYTSGQFPGDDNRIWAQAGTQADKAVKTAQLMSELMKRPPITPARFETARSQTEESYGEAFQLSEIPRRILALSRLGFRTDPAESSVKQLKSYPQERLDRFTARFKDKPLTIYVVGDRNRVDIEGLKKLGDFQEVGVDDLFPY